MFLVHYYQIYIRGVDRGDQLIGCYNMGRRSKKWQVFSYLIECSLLNAYILEKYANPHLHAESNKGCSKQDFLSFRIDVAHQLIGHFLPYYLRIRHPSTSWFANSGGSRESKWIAQNRSIICVKVIIRITVNVNWHYSSAKLVYMSSPKQARLFF